MGLLNRCLEEGEKLPDEIGPLPPPYAAMFVPRFQLSSVVAPLYYYRTAVTGLNPGQLPRRRLARSSHRSPREQVCLSDYVAG